MMSLCKNQLKTSVSTGSSSPLIFKGVFVALLLAGLVACKPKTEDAGHGGMPQMPPPEVSVITVEPKTTPIVLEYTGQIVGVRDVEVRARVTGILMKRNFVEGGTVRAGQSLFTIDPAPFQAAVARAEADLASAQASLAKADRDTARFKPLIEAHAIAQKDYDDAVSAQEIAAASVKAAQTRLTDAKLNLSYTRVDAPISGVTGRLQVTEGSLVSGPDVLLTTLTQVNPVYAGFGVSDNDRLKLEADAKAKRLILPKGGLFEVALKLADGSTYAAKGKINFSDFRVNTTTGTTETRAEMPNPAGELRPGQFVHVLLSGAQRPDAILVPQRAVLEGPQGKFVFVASKDNKAEIHPVEVGEWAGDSWIIQKGLQTGDRVIVDGVTKLGPGAPIKVADASAQNTAPKAAK